VEATRAAAGFIFGGINHAVPAERITKGSAPRIHKHSEAVALVLLLARAGRLFPFCLFAQVRNALPRPLGGIKESERFSAPLCVLFQLGS
jgi:hypothetical protein